MLSLRLVALTQTLAYWRISCSWVGASLQGSGLTCQRRRDGRSTISYFSNSCRALVCRLVTIGPHLLRTFQPFLFIECQSRGLPQLMFSILTLQRVLSKRERTVSRSIVSEPMIYEQQYKAQSPARSMEQCLPDMLPNLPPKLPWIGQPYPMCDVTDGVDRGERGGSDQRPMQQSRPRTILEKASRAAKPK